MNKFCLNNCVLLNGRDVRFKGRLDSQQLIRLLDDPGCLLVGCFASQRHVSASHGRIC